MASFGSAFSSGVSAREAAAAALERARASFADPTPKLALVFVSANYDDADEAVRMLRAALGPNVPLTGGTAGGCVFGPDGIARRGVSVVLVGGNDVEVANEHALIDGPHLLAAVPAAERVARAADIAARRGFANMLCLVFAPGGIVDGDALVAAVRKGAGARAQLAGGLAGDELTFDRTRIVAGDELRRDRVVVTGIFTRDPVGIAARHGYQPAGPVHTVTRSDGSLLLEIDGRPALDVWLEDVRALGAEPPTDHHELAMFLANYYELGITEKTIAEPIVRAPVAVRGDRSIVLAAGIAQGQRVRVLHATRDGLLRASSEAAAEAVRRVGGDIAGALVLSCTGRLAALGDAFDEEMSSLRQTIGAPIGGACVYGEIAKGPRDADAFFTTTVVAVAFGT